MLDIEMLHPHVCRSAGQSLELPFTGARQVADAGRDVEQVRADELACNEEEPALGVIAFGDSGQGAVEAALAHVTRLLNDVTEGGRDG
ncbi:MAG TPA: hypothetical protein DCX80_13375 [Chloroflexi bacterium]|nr:hypothetical protein [Chloroflexota bacterium]